MTGAPAVVPIAAPPTAVAIPSSRIVVAKRTADTVAVMRIRSWPPRTAAAATPTMAYMRGFGDLALWARRPASERVRVRDGGLAPLHEIVVRGRRDAPVRNGHGMKQVWVSEPS